MNDLGRLIVHDREMHLEPGSRRLVVGSTVKVIRGNGPREGDVMGVATLVGIIDCGDPVLHVHFYGQDEQGE